MVFHFAKLGKATPVPKAKQGLQNNVLSICIPMNYNDDFDLANVWRFCPKIANYSDVLCQQYGHDIA